MAGSRLAVVARVDATYRDTYTAIFGPWPTFTATLPKSGRPGEPAFDSLPETDRAAVNQIFANVGKAIEAFERSVAHNQPASRFDRYLDGDKTALTDDELAGAALFLSAGCATCHHGPALSDGGFHDILMPSQEAPADRGRLDGLAALLASPFRADGAFSDAPTSAPRLGELVVSEALLGQQKTPSLRNVTKTAPYGHAGTFETIGEVLAHYGKPRPPPVAGGLTVGVFDPTVGLFAAPHAHSIEAFLGTLTSP
jgi:cytochrome c peroxidase